MDDFSSWQSPLVVALKKSGEVRICVDLRQLNRAVQRQPNPFPSFEDLSTKFCGAKRFSILDIKDAFHQIALAKQYRHYTTLATMKGVYRYTRIPFGLASAPVLFQRVMRYVLRGLRGILIYLDNIVVFGIDQEAHDSKLFAVLHRLEEYCIRRT